MQLVPYSPVTHYPQLLMLLAQHGMEPVSVSSIPALGFVMEHDGDAVAIGFMRLVEGGFGQVDGLIVNQSYRGKDRSDALDEVIKACIKEAESIGITQVFALCVIKPPIERAVKHGFAILPCTVLGINLKGS